MPYTQEQYQRAKSAVSSGNIPPDKLAHVAQRIAEFEGKKPGMGNLRAMEGTGGPLEVDVNASTGPRLTQVPPTMAEVDAKFGPEYLEQSKSFTADAIRQTGEVLDPQRMEQRRQQVDWSKKLTTNPALKNASKLKVFDDPPDYDPPKDLPGMSLLPKATTSYFEPTVGEFRAVMMSNPRVKAALHEEYPDPGTDVEKLDEQSMENSAAYKAYADARWQHALADALRTKTPITRVQFSDKTGSIDPTTGERKLNLTGHASNLMDSSMSLMTGALQGATGGLYDLGLSLGGDTNKRRAQVAEMTGATIEPLGTDLGKETRDAGRGSRERNPITGMVGTIGGALDPRQLPSKVAGGLGKLAGKVASPKSLPGRTATSAAIGAGTTVIDENMRAAADLAADALDADKSARETALSIVQGLPGLNPVTAGVGAGLGAGADLLGAGFGAGKRAMTQGDRLRAPLKHFEESGGQMGPLMQRRVSPEAEGYQARADKARTTPQDLIVDEIGDSMATQRLLEQESALRGAQSDASVAHAKMEGQTVTPSVAAARIQALGGSKPGATPASRGAKSQLDEFADRLSQEQQLTAEGLDKFIDEAAEAAKYGRATGPVEHWDEVGKYLRDLRDEFKLREEATVVTDPPDKGLFTADPDVTIAEPPARQIGGVRDKTGQVKAVQDYSAEQVRQSKLKGFHKDMNKRLGLPEEIQADTVLSEPVVSKGLFDPKTPQEIVEGIPPKARLSEDQRTTFEGAIRKTSGRDYLKHRREMEALAERTDTAAGHMGSEGADFNAGGSARKGDLPIAKKLQVVRQLDDRDQLSQALGAAVDQLNSSGFANIGMLKKIGFRAIPTLKSLSGGLPSRPVTPGVSDQAVARLREFIPEWEALHLRGGKPTRVVGAARDEEKPQEGKFSPEEKAFWIRVIEKITEQQKPQKVATQ